MYLGRRLEIETVAEIAFDDRLNLPVPTQNGGWIVSYQDRGGIHVLDSRLTEINRLDLSAQSNHYCSTGVSMSRDGQYIALSARTKLRIVNRQGTDLQNIPHPRWGTFAGSSCFFDEIDRLWYVRPGSEPGINDCLVVIDPLSGSTIAEQTIENGVGHFALFPHPFGQSVLIDVACGQDGSFLYIASLAGASLSIKSYPYGDRTFYGGFAPNGREFATGAHQGDAVKVHSFPDGQVVATLESKEAFKKDELAGEYPDQIGYQALFLDDDHLLVESQYGRMLLIDRHNMELPGTVWPSGYVIHGYDKQGKETNDPTRIMSSQGELTSFHPAGEGKLLSVFNERVLRLLDTSSLLSTLA